ncbi:hypothetical protein Lupro_06305 [Lutibacter profundi]|uniref:Uncharacterized protein n=1 Tax=Lutibacter profundi TaxID=1622118 RepID=A0A0X8G6D9_9FLAO|nr:hypothetical protein [Lutibacter profundi]AMC10879.1 hypothetical protein Lupro_06305 [Lutibacter profundi]
MKKNVTLIVLTIFLTFNSLAQKKYFAEVYVVNGVEAYILNEPVRPYEIVYGKGQSINWSSYLTGGLINNSISTKVGKFIKGIVKKATKDNKQIDAVIYTSGKNVTAIKFTDEPTSETKQKATVHRLNGIPTYVMCEPYNEFRVAKSKKGGIKWKSAFTAGLINNSIEQDLMKFAKKYKKMYTKNQIDALYYTSGKSCDGIIFDNN